MSLAPAQPVEGFGAVALEAVEPVTARPVSRSRGQALSQAVGAFAGRLLDLLVAGILLLVLAPLMAVVALAIRFDSVGPVLFRQRRVGRGRDEFTMFKFRTMSRHADASPHREYVASLISGDHEPDRGASDGTDRTSAEHGGDCTSAEHGGDCAGPGRGGDCAGLERGGDGKGSEHGARGDLYKLSVDDRITRVGRFLRSWSIDELPQLINVLRGEMSLVGPRPVIGYEVEMYPDSYLRRFAVKPGLTGLWQVSGRNERTYDEMVSFDIEYAERASLLLDLRILAKTIPVVLRRQGVA